MSTTTKQAEEAARLRGLAEPCVWTERMLASLSQDGPKGGKWHSLIDKVWALPTLRQAWVKVKANDGAAGVDKQSIQMFQHDAEHHLLALQRHLQTDRYRPQPVRRVWIDKPGKKEKRPLGIPAVCDRVVQTALRLVLEPIFEHDFAACSYGFRPGRGNLNALGKVDAYLKAGYVHVIDADLKSYFDTIPHSHLLACVEQRIADGRIMALLRSYLTTEVWDGLHRWTPERGTPQGAVISPLLANIYLNELDWRLTRANIPMVRFADDFVILCRTRDEANAALTMVEAFCGERGLTLHPEKTRIVDASQKGGGFDFLGYHFERGSRWPSKKAVQRLRAKVKPLTKRTNGQCMNAIVQRLNPILRGWCNYFQYGSWLELQNLDGYVRGRLRSILRKRHKRRGKGRGRDHQRWPNAYFHALGLFSLKQAQEAFCQSLQTETH